MKENKIIKDKDTKDIMKSLWSVMTFFVLTLVVGVFAIKYPILLGYGIVCLGFLLFNGIMLIYKVLQSMTKKILGE